MSHFVPQPLFLVGSWVRNSKDPEWPQFVLPEVPGYKLPLATPEYSAAYRPAAAVAEDHARKQEQDERVGFGVDRSAPSGLAAWLPNAGPSAAPSVLAGTTTCATCGKVHGLLCALAIDRILKKQALEDAEPVTSLRPRALEMV